MKNSLICSALLLLAMVAHAQSGRQGTPPSSTSVNQQAGAAWYRGGNLGPPNGLSGDNTFGTRWNSPIYTITDTISRMKLNGTLTTGQYSINAYNASHGVNTSGYLLLGSNSTVTPISNKNIYSDMGAFSLLHLNGPRPGELSYRPWMQTGVTFTDAGDLGYVGLRFGNGLGSGNVVSEMVVAWGNDSIDALGGPDDMVFRFMGAPSSDHSTTPSTNVNTSRDYDGKQIARFSANGNVGIGPSYTQLVASQPTHRLDVEGNARLRNVPGSNAPEYIMLGNVQSSNPADIDFQRLALPGTSNMFLSGNGTWQAISSGGGAINGAHNGASVSGSGNSMVAFGQSYSQSGTNPAALQDSRYVPMNDNNIYFTNNPTNPLSNTGFNKVAIGTDNPNLVGKLNVYSQNSGEGTALSLTNVATTGASGSEIHVNGVTPTTGLNNWGERIYVSGSLSSNQGTEYVISGGNEAIGVTIDATGGTNGLGLRATASGSSTGTVTGVLAVASGGNINYGVRAQAPTTPNSYAGSFLGNVEVVGTGTANAWLTSSDRRYKQDIKALESVNEKLEKLNGYTYSMRTDEFKDKNFATAQQIGLIAQEVQEVFPQLVHEDGKGYLAVNYDGMVPVLLEALKEQQQQIDALKSQVAALSLNPGATNGQVIDLSNVKAIVLDQNAPNPFAEQTVIHYALPTEVRTAKMLFHDGSGNLVQSVDITDRGNGRLIVYGTRLAAGAYTYSLMADGKIVDTKVMVKQ